MVLEMEMKLRCGYDSIGCMLLCRSLGTLWLAIDGRDQDGTQILPPCSLESVLWP